MSSQKVDAEVHREGRVVDTVTSRPVRLLPDGRAGIVFGGAVYPLYADHTICLDDASVEKDLCLRFARATDELRYAATSEVRSNIRSTPRLSTWFLEENRYGFYLVFDGVEATAQAVADELDQAGIRVKRWDASHRPASDGHHYDWFIRLADDDAATPQRVREALGLAGRAERRHVDHIDAQSEDDGSRSLELLERLDQLEARLPPLQARIGDLQLLADALTGENQELIAELARARRESSAAKRSARQREVEFTAIQAARDRISKELDSLRLRLEEVTQRDGDDQDLRLSALQQDNQALFVEWESSEARVEALGVELIRVQGELEAAVRSREEVEDELALVREATSSPAELSRGMRGTRGGLESFLEALLPRTTLHPDAVDALSSADDPGRMLDVLIELDRFERGRGNGLPARALDGHKPWREIDSHLATGARGATSAGGRVYFTAQAGRVWAMVQHKTDGKSQEQALRRLKMWRPWPE